MVISMAQRALIVVRHRRPHPRRFTWAEPPLKYPSRLSWFFPHGWRRLDPQRTAITPTGENAPMNPPTHTA
jgi:hypothetical protein